MRMGINNIIQRLENKEVSYRQAADELFKLHGVASSPTHEETVKESKRVGDECDLDLDAVSSCRYGFMKGANWMKEKLNNR